MGFILERRIVCEKTIWVGLSLLLALPCFAYQPQIRPIYQVKWGNRSFALSGNIRTRFEYQGNYNIKKYGIKNDDAFFLERLRLNFNFILYPSIRAFLQIQDAHVLGLSLPAYTFKPSNPYFDPFDIRQGFLEIKPIEWLDFKIGRQQISYGDARILGPGQWGNTGRYAWDAIVATINNQYIKTHLLVGRYLIRDPNKWPNPNIHYPTGYAIYSTIKRLPFNLDLFYVLKRDCRKIKQGEAGKGIWNANSIGFYLFDQFKHIDYSATYVYQWGWWGRDKIRAYGYNFQIGYTFPFTFKPHFKLQYTCGSGDKDPNDGIHGTFDGVFGGVDRFYGRMNFLGWMNLRDYEIDLEIKPHPALLIKTAYHYFTLDDKKDAWYFPNSKPQRWDKAGNSGKAIGHEIDTEAIFRYQRYEWRMGLSTFIPLNFAKNTGPSPHAYWYFLQMMIWF